VYISIPRGVALNSHPAKALYVPEGTRGPVQSSIHNRCNDLACRRWIASSDLNLLAAAAGFYQSEKEYALPKSKRELLPGYLYL